jgi:hypothetical protein
MRVGVWQYSASYLDWHDLQVADSHHASRSALAHYHKKLDFGFSPFG